MFSWPKRKFFCYLFTHEALGSSLIKNWLKRVRVFQINLEVLVFKERGELEEKPLGPRKRTNNEPNPHIALMPRFEPGPDWWEAPPLLSWEPGLARKSNLLSGDPTKTDSSGNPGETAKIIVTSADCLRE